MTEKKSKLIFKTTDILWSKVKKYTIDNNKKNNNDSVEELVEKGLNK